MVGGPGARLVIGRFARDDDPGVVEEMLRAWRLSPDPEEYARTVLADMQFGDRCLDVRGNHRVRQLRHLTQLRVVRCRGDVVDVAPLADIPQLEHLELVQNDVLRDLSPLARCRSLAELHLNFCPLLRDLSPLGRSSVQRLSLHFMAGLDFGSLTGMRQLRVLTVRDPAIAGGLDRLPADLALRELSIQNRLPETSLRGIERWPTLERLEVAGVPRAEDIERLAALPALCELVIIEAAAKPHLAGLRELPALRRLRLEGQRLNRTAITALVSRPGLGVQLKSTD